MLLLLEAQEGNWDEIDLMVRALPGRDMALRYANVPVVVAPAGLTLGGGCEIALHGDRVQAAAETYIGLVEVGVGLIPAGGGTKEMLARAVESPGARRPTCCPPCQRVFETIGFAKVVDQRRRRAAPRIPARRRRRHDEPRAAAVRTRRRRRWNGSARAISRRCRARRSASAARACCAALKLGVHLAWRAGRISDHDALIGRKLAGILAGGALPHATT